MSISLDDHDFRHALSQIFDQMAKKGIHIADETKEEITKELVSEIKLKKDDIKDVNVQKKLFGLISSYIRGDKAEFNERLRALKDEDLRLEPNLQLNKKLDNELKLLAVLSLVLAPIPNNQAPTIAANDFVKKMMECHPGKKDASKNEEINLIAKEMQSALELLWGGKDPRIPSSIPTQILGPIFDFYGSTNLAPSDPNNKSFATMQDTYNADITDGFGNENKLAMNALSEGIIDILVNQNNLSQEMVIADIQPGGPHLVA